MYILHIILFNNNYSGWNEKGMRVYWTTSSNAFQYFSFILASFHKMVPKF